MDENDPNDSQLKRLRAEAASLLNIKAPKVIDRQTTTRQTTTDKKKSPAGEPVALTTSHRPVPDARAHGPRATGDGFFIVSRAT